MQIGIEMMPFCFKASYFFGVIVASPWPLPPGLLPPEPEPFPLPPGLEPEPVDFPLGSGTTTSLPLEITTQMELLPATFSR